GSGAADRRRYQELAGSRITGIGQAGRGGGWGQQSAERTESPRTNHRTSSLAYPRRGGGVRARARKKCESGHDSVSESTPIFRSPSAIDGNRLSSHLTR